MNDFDQVYSNLYTGEFELSSEYANSAILQFGQINDLKNRKIKSIVFANRFFLGFGPSGRGDVLFSNVSIFVTLIDSSDTAIFDNVPVNLLAPIGTLGTFTDPTLALGYLPIQIESPRAVLWSESFITVKFNGASLLGVLPYIIDYE